jgi:ribosomal protein S18 acetylase RimI-like enzyme
MPVTVELASDADIPEIADVAAKTFPLACPPALAAENISAFIESNLSPQRFEEYLAAADRKVFVARDKVRILGYAIVIDGIGGDEDVSRAVTLRPAIELSKLYVLPDQRGQGVAGFLMAEAISIATDAEAQCLWLGVNQLNQRAQRFYAKHGFAIAGTKTFKVGSKMESDFVMMRPVP